MHALARLVTALACSTTVLAAQCYFPNGGKVDSDTACNPNALVSACCYDNQACLSNGLCVSDPHDPVKARLHRGTCTDADWKSGNCPRHCLDIDNNGVPVYSCNSTSTDSYCCYDGCDCQANSGFEIFTFAQSPADVYTVTIIGESYTQTHTSAASSTSSSIATTSSASTSASASASTAVFSAASSASIASASATSTPSSAAEPTKKSNTTALGVGLGVGIPVAALIGVGVFFLLRRRRNRNGSAAPSEMAADEYALHPRSPSTKYAYMAEAEVAAGRDAPPVTQELSGERNEKPVELPATAPSAPSTAGGAQAVELESPLSSPRETTNRPT
ncbi:hypothetical protein BU25DRAFT_444628 [Macroventuria anomochaeta]|uniref:Uncharacterized protein n=1 Tax=Macroventuria anomochaeta TaxID=301207 RepID=A0ACB6SDZ9_9PLEO|nr:uncharacterized protein BU25DRAFT_444628 [Macroventuria anomochaeta]KAF2632535.1 hypothetical protein BU25DRAFT_444628 [Macroventuria anomochaeta]